MLHLLKNVLPFQSNQAGVVGKGDKVVVEVSLISFGTVNAQRNGNMNRYHIAGIVPVHGTGTVYHGNGILFRHIIRQGLPCHVQYPLFLCNVIIKHCVFLQFDAVPNDLIGEKLTCFQHSLFLLCPFQKLGVPLSVMLAECFLILVQGSGG